VRGPEAARAERGANLRKGEVRKSQSVKVVAGSSGGAGAGAPGAKRRAPQQAEGLSVHLKVIAGVFAALLMLGPLLQWYQMWRQSEANMIQEKGEDE